MSKRRERGPLSLKTDAKWAAMEQKYKPQLHGKKGKHNGKREHRQAQEVAARKNVPEG